jgi:hypothetical protein
LGTLKGESGSRSEYQDPKQDVWDPKFDGLESDSFLCVRSLDLMGRNLKKVEGMVNKINTRQGKDKTLGFLSK